MPVTGHLVSGRVFDLHGVLLSDAIVTLKHISFDESIPSVVTNTKGEYILNLAKLSSQWSKGDNITVTATKSGEGTKSETVTIQGIGRQTVNLTLAETSDLSFYENPRDVYNLNFALLTHYDGEKVTRERPLPVSSSEIDLLNNPSHSWTITRGDGQPDSETVTIRGVRYTRNFTYENNNMIMRSEWVRQS